MSDFFEFDSPDIHWLSATLQLGVIQNAAPDRDPAWPSLVADALEMITSTHGGAANYTLFTCWVVDSMSWANQGVCVAEFEQVLHRTHHRSRLPVPGGLPAAGDGRPRQPARRPRDRTRMVPTVVGRRPTRDGRIVSNTRTMVRAIEAELRLGPDRERDRIDQMLDELTDRCNHLGLDPGWRPFLVQARAENAANGKPFNPPLALPRLSTHQ